MAELWQQIISQGQLQSALELIATALALAYTLLAIRHSLWCWPAALLSTLLSMQIMWQANLITEVVTQCYYAAMAIYGWRQWQVIQAQTGEPTQVLEWRFSKHSKLIAGTVLIGVLFGALMATLTQTDFAWLGAQLTCFAVLGTYLTAQKVLSNWLYWVVIDAVSVYMYMQQGLYFFAALFVLYTIIAASGYLTWRHNFRQQQQSSKSGIFVSG